MKRIKFLPVVLALVFAAGFLIRLHGIVFPVPNGDPHRDYLIANHIATWHEFPLSGPPNSVFWYIKNSPLYYYLLAGLLTIWNDLLLLNIANVILQMAGIFILWLLAKKMFGTTTALIALFLIVFNKESAYHSVYVWQPNMMEAFADASYLFLFLAYQSKKFAPLAWSAFFFCTALALHISAFAGAPLFACIVAFILARDSRGAKRWLAVLGISAALLFLYFAPAFLNYNHFSLPQGGLLQGKPFVGQVPAFLSRFAASSQTYAAIIVPGVKTPAGGILFLLLLALATAAYFVSSTLQGGTHEPHRLRRWFVLAIFLMALSYIFASAALNHDTEGYYYTAVLGMSLILIAELVNRAIPFRPRGVRYALVAFVLAAAAFANGRALSANTSADYFGTRQSVERSFATIRQEVADQGRAIAKTQPDFFQVFTYRNMGGSVFEKMTSAMFWNYFEHAMRRPFTKVPPYDLYDYTVTNGTQVLFLVCEYETPLPHLYDDNCKQAFTEDIAQYGLSGYVVEKTLCVDDLFSIYVAVKEPRKPVL